MNVRTLASIRGTDRDVEASNWRSRRLVLQGDGIGFSVHDTVIKAGTETYMWYRNHVEAVYCIEGEGEVEEKGGAIHPIRPGTIYVLDGHEQHYLRARTDLRMVCVFQPPLTGSEVHDEAGVYPLLEPAATAAAADSPAAAPATATAAAAVAARRP